MARTGQAATELVIILGVALVVVVLFFVLSANMLTDARTQQNYDDARVSVQTLLEAADSVYAQGEGATRKVTIIIPTDTNFGSNYTYIGAPSSSAAAQNGININVNGTDVSGLSRTALSGKFPAKAGKYTMRVTSRGAYVEIYPYLVDVDKRSIAIVMARGETRSATITVTRVSLETVTVEPSKNWGFADVTMNVAPSTAFAGSSAGTTITVTVTSNAFASNIYNSQITLTAIGNESKTSESINIPVSVNVINGEGACRPTNAVCSQTSQCCMGFECNNGTCNVPCSPVTGACATTDNCCTGTSLTCRGSACMYACSDIGYPCNTPGYTCCEGYECANGNNTCSAIVACSSEGNGCEVTGDCCAGMCYNNVCTACAGENGDCNTICCDGFACNLEFACVACYNSQESCSGGKTCCAGLACNANDICVGCQPREGETCDPVDGPCCSGLTCDNESKTCIACESFVGRECDTGNPCCDGLTCNNATNMCELTATCLSQNTSCVENSECCTGLFCTSAKPACTKPRCAIAHLICTTCVQNGNDCSQNETCCEGFACDVNSLCVACQQNIGDGCDPSRPCCSGLTCNNDTSLCELQLACNVHDQGCTNTSECCSGLFCDIKKDNVCTCMTEDSGCDQNRTCCDGLACNVNSACVVCKTIETGCDPENPCCSGLACNAKGTCTTCEGTAVGDSCDPVRAPCCNGLSCNTVTEMCEVAAESCFEVSRMCLQNTDCCSGLHCDGVCAACRPEPSGCDTDIQCCTGRCNGVVCECAPVGRDCSQGQTCCSGLACNTEYLCNYCGGTSVGDRCNPVKEPCCNGLTCNPGTGLCE